jgi:sugar transferase EpsL
MSIYRSFGKRFVDLLLSSIAVLLLIPVFALSTAVIFISLGPPIFFCQQRPGFRGKPFTIYKFRTMTDARDRMGNVLSDGERLTKIGRFFRSISLDELPELINIIRGDMSLVGPRPLLMEYLPRYSSEQMRRHDVLPGVTGWSQINGRNAISWEKRFELDLHYVDNLSFALDIRIILKTFCGVIARADINQSGHATRQGFSGTRADDKSE